MRNPEEIALAPDDDASVEEYDIDIGRMGQIEEKWRRTAGNGVVLNISHPISSWEFGRGKRRFLWLYSDSRM